MSAARSITINALSIGAVYGTVHGIRLLHGAFQQHGEQPARLQHTDTTATTADVNPTTARRLSFAAVTSGVSSFLVAAANSLRSSTQPKSNESGASQIFSDTDTASTAPSELGSDDDEADEQQQDAIEEPVDESKVLATIDEEDEAGESPDAAEIEAETPSSKSHAFIPCDISDEDPELTEDERCDDGEADAASTYEQQATELYDLRGYPIQPLVSREEMVGYTEFDWDIIFDKMLLWNRAQWEDWRNNPTYAEKLTRERQAEIQDSKFFSLVSKKTLAAGTFGKVSDIAGLWGYLMGWNGACVIKTLKVDSYTDEVPRLPEQRDEAFCTLRKACKDMIREYETMLRFQSNPNIVTPYKLIMHADGLSVSIIMMKANAGSLENWLEPKTSFVNSLGITCDGKANFLTTHQAHRLIADISSALATMHDANLGHFDLKAGNIMVVNHSDPNVPLADADLQFLLADFGLCRDFAPHVKNAIGTMETWAPELWNETGSFVPSVDIFALGITAMEALGISGLRFVQVNNTHDYSVRQWMVYHQGIYDERFLDWVDLVACDPARRPSASAVMQRFRWLEAIATCSGLDRRQKGKALFEHYERAGYLDAVEEIYRHHACIFRLEAWIP